MEDLAARMVGSQSVDHELLINELQVGISNTGSMVETIYDLAIHPTRKLDPDAIGAASLALIAYLKHVDDTAGRLERVLYALRSADTLPDQTKL
ncbi:hypothetical protein ACFSC3_09175 [Sphingomonas floccifaciens]|uniref:Uncharacterized protein n=1 Tax=Sphingomonas floccifaciens TaxID=1844115 RepID=A0ABW4NCK6_9SPHN